MNNFFTYIAFCILALPLFNTFVYANEVLTTVEEAVNQYKNGDFEGAASNLDYAAQLIRQKKSESLKEVFPEPFAGWEADPATSQATGTAVFGRSVSVSRTFVRDTSIVTIDIVSDSPIMQSLVLMLNNPVIAGAGGAKLETFGTHKGIVQFDATTLSGDVNIVVDERFMVTVNGQNVERDELIAYAQAVKYPKLVQK